MCIVLRVVNIQHPTLTLTPLLTSFCPYPFTYTVIPNRIDNTAPTTHHNKHRKTAKWLTNIRFTFDLTSLSNYINHNVDNVGDGD